MDTFAVKNTADLDIGQLNLDFATRAPQDILAWSWETFQPRVVTSSSFQTQSLVLLHMIAQICPQMPVIFTDTGYHFPETLAFRDELKERFGLNVQTVFAAPAPVEYRSHATEPLYMRDPDLCCRINKIVPFNQALAGNAAWVAGVRRDQTSHRSQMQVLERRNDGIIKIHPILNWTSRDIWTYSEEHDLPVHPLFLQGYMSVGCAPCTRPVSAGEDERSGRWAGTDKTECGLHTNT
jgi:phosphoadenosine phosphosulfate reductase